MGEGGREGGRARVVPGSHTSFSFLPPLTLFLFSLLAAFSSLPISNGKRKQFKAPAHPPALARQKRCTSMYFPRLSPQGREGGRGAALLLLEGRSVDSTRDSNSSSTAPERTQQHSRDQSLLCLAADGRGRRVLCKSHGDPIADFAVLVIKLTYGWRSGLEGISPFATTLTMMPDLAEPVPLSQLVLIRGLIPSKQRQKTKCPPTCSSVKTSAMAGDWQILRPLPPHLPLIPSNEFMPEIQGKKRAPTGLPSRFQVSLVLYSIFIEFV